MKIVTTVGKEIETKTTRDPDMESSIVDTMRRYFQNDSGKPQENLEYAIMDSVKRYFESPGH
jgi:hypothetical protein